MTLQACAGTWTCPYCGLWGQTMASDPEATNLSAHLRVVRCHEEPAAFGPGRTS